MPWILQSACNGKRFFLLHVFFFFQSSAFSSSFFFCLSLFFFFYIPLLSFLCSIFLISTIPFSSSFFLAIVRWTPLCHRLLLCLCLARCFSVIADPAVDFPATVVTLAGVQPLFCPSSPSGHSAIVQPLWAISVTVSMGSASTTTIVSAFGSFWPSIHLSGSVALVVTFVVQPVCCSPLSSVSGHLHLHLSLLSALSALSGQSAVGHLFWPRSVAWSLCSVVIRLSFGR